MIHVYLDDYRPCPQGFVAALSAEECKLLIDEETIDILSLDYDLGWGEPTGFEVVRHIVNTGKFPRRIYLHTSSPQGRLRMYHALSANLPPDVQLSGGAMTQSILNEAAFGRL